MTRASEFKQKVREDNQKAQEQVLVVELNSVTDLLSQRNKDLALAEKAIEVLRVARVRLSQENLILQESSAALRIQEDRNRGYIEKASKDLDAKLLYTEGRIVHSLKDADSKLSAQERQITSNNKLLSDQDTLVLILREGLNATQKNIEVSTNTVRDLSIQIRQKQQDLYDLNQGYDLAVKTIDKAIELKKSELVKATQTLEEESAKYESPLKSFEREEVRMKVERNDLHILNTRMRDRWRLVYPDKPMPI